MNLPGDKHIHGGLYWNPYLMLFWWGVIGVVLYIAYKFATAAWNWAQYWSAR